MEQALIQEPAYRVPEAARRSGLAASTLWRLLRLGKIACLGGVGIARSEVKRGFMVNRKCRKRNRSGLPCKASAGPSGLCRFHANPELARTLGSRGGKSNRRPSIAPETPLNPPQDADQVRAALGRIMADVHNGTLDTRRATAVTYTATAYLKALEVSDLEARIAALEQKANESKKQS